MKKVLVLLLAIIMTVGITSCGSENRDSSWPETGLGALIPKPEKGIIEIVRDREDRFKANVEKVSTDFYRDYIEKCRAEGFNIDEEEDSDFTAFNADGVKLELSYHKSSEKIRIELEAGKTMGTFTWPKNAYGAKVPQTESSYGVVEWESSDGFCMYVGKTSIEDFSAYVEKCIDAGFDVDYTKHDKSFSGENADGDSLRVSYEGANVIFIRIDAKEDAKDVTNETEITSDEPTTAPTEAPAPTAAPTKAPEKSKSSVHEALVAYEAFIDEYCAFMKKYNDSDDILGMIGEYTKYIEKLSEMEKKIDGLDSSEMTDAELKEYLDVTTRCSKKLLDAI